MKKKIRSKSTARTRENGRSNAEPHRGCPSSPLAKRPGPASSQRQAGSRWYMPVAPIHLSDRICSSTDLTLGRLVFSGWESEIYWLTRGCQLAQSHNWQASTRVGSEQVAPAFDVTRPQTVIVSLDSPPLAANTSTARAQYWLRALVPEVYHMTAFAFQSLWPPGPRRRCRARDRLAAIDEAAGRDDVSRCVPAWRC